MADFPSYNFSIRRGNTGTVKSDEGLELRFLIGDQPLDLTGSEIHFFARAGGADIVHWTEGEDLFVNPSEGGVCVRFRDPATFRSVPRGQKIRYEIERRFNGQQRCLLEGVITLVEGLSDD